MPLLEAELFPILPVVVSVIEENFFSRFDIAERFEAGGFPTVGHNQEDIRIIRVIDVASVIRLGAFSDNDVGATDPKQISSERTVRVVEFSFGDDLAGVIPDRIFNRDRLFGEEAQTSPLNSGGLDLKSFSSPFFRSRHI